MHNTAKETNGYIKHFYQTSPSCHANVCIQHFLQWNTNIFLVNKPFNLLSIDYITDTLCYSFSGTCSTEHTDPVPFVIEWIPDILPHSQVGELRIRFEYGHQVGGKPEGSKSSAGMEKTDQTVTDTSPNQ